MDDLRRLAAGALEALAREGFSDDEQAWLLGILQREGFALVPVEGQQAALDVVALRKALQAADDEIADGQGYSDLYMDHVVSVYAALKEQPRGE